MFCAYNRPMKQKSKTAQALELVQSGQATLRQAAAQFNITPQSIYRLMAYRKDNPPCPTCGR
jgi:molybdopterin/thiamine biosynthesis adenylyltransferase